MSEWDEKERTRKKGKCYNRQTWSRKVQEHVIVAAVEYYSSSMRL